MLAFLVLALATWVTPSPAVVSSPTPSETPLGDVVVQDFTSVPAFFFCYELTLLSFVFKPLNQYICHDYLSAILANQIGVVLNPVIYASSLSNDWDLVGPARDDEVRSFFSGATMTGSCSERQKLAQLCANYFIPCNFTVVSTDYVEVPPCRESCQYTRGCTFSRECGALDAFNSSNVTACSLNSMALNVIDGATSLAAALLLLLF